MKTTTITNKKMKTKKKQKMMKPKIEQKCMPTNNKDFPIFPRP